MYESLGQYMKHQRVLKSMFASEVARKVKIPCNFYQDIENDRRRPTPEQFKRIQEVLELDLMACASAMKNQMAEEEMNGSIQ